MAWEREQGIVAGLEEGDVVVIRGLHHDIAGVVRQTDVIDLKIVVTSPKGSPDYGRETWVNASRIKEVKPPGTEVEIETDYAHPTRPVRDLDDVEWHDADYYIRKAAESDVATARKPKPKTEPQPKTEPRLKAKEPKAEPVAPVTPESWGQRIPRDPEEKVRWREALRLRRQNAVQLDLAFAEGE